VLFQINFPPLSRVSRHGYALRGHQNQMLFEGNRFLMRDLEQRAAAKQLQDLIFAR
jgi:hypothetical protein